MYNGLNSWISDKGDCDTSGGQSKILRDDYPTIYYSTVLFPQVIDDTSCHEL
mgnify:CR=1 FL=1